MSRHRIQSDSSQDERVIEFGNFSLDVIERSLLDGDGRSIQLTPRLFETLLYLVERPGRLVHKQSLMDAVWAGVVVEENTLSRTISALRRVLGERAGDNRYIATIPGAGYRFVQAVRSVRAEHAYSDPPSHSIAVLPFDDLSPKRDQQYFADGIAEEVLNRLAYISGLRVIARASSFRFRGAAQSARAIGEKLDVAHLLTGALRKDGDHLRINVELVQAATGRQLWSRQFDREVGDIFAIQADIAKAVATALSLSLAKDVASLAKASTTSVDAYDLFLRALSRMHESGGPSRLRALELLRKALALDPGFAPAWLAIAALTRGLLIFLPERTDELRRDLEEATAKAVELMPESWAAHLALSAQHHGRQDWRRMQQAMARAAELVANLPAELGMTMGGLHAQVGDIAAAIELLREAVRNDPLSLLMSGVYQIQLHIAGHEELAEREYQRSLGLHGDRDMVEHLALLRAWARGDDDRDRFRRYLDHQSLALPVLFEVFEAADRPENAAAMLRAAASQPEYADAMRQLILAWWLAHYGDDAAAFDCVWRSFVELGYFNANLLWLPVLSRTRRDPRFQELLMEIGLIDYWRSRGNWGELYRPI